MLSLFIDCTDLEMSTKQMKKKIARMQLPREGLNNQRISILGFLILCSEQGYEPIIPKYCIDHISKNYVFQNPINFLFHLITWAKYYFKSKIMKPKLLLSDIYHKDLFDTFTMKPVSGFSRSILFYRIKNISFSKSLLHGFMHLEKETTRSEVTAETKKILKCLSASSEIRSIAENAMELLPSPILGVGFRLEKDWIRHINSKLYTGSLTDQAIFTPHNIFNTLNNLRDATGIYNFYLCCDSSNLTCTHQEAYNYAKKYNINIYFQHHFSDILNKFKSIISLSMFDFEIASLCNGFVGSDKSTFNNMVKLYSSVNATKKMHYLFTSSIGGYVSW